MPLSSEERRRHPRVRLGGRTGGRATVFADFKVIELSESGASLEMADALVVGAECILTLDLSQVAVELSGRVVTVEPAVEVGGPFQVVVEFLQAEALDQQLLEAFLDRKRQWAGA